MLVALVLDNGTERELKNRRKTPSFTLSTEISPKEQMETRIPMHL
jgi:hypothetical protein